MSAENNTVEVSPLEMRIAEVEKQVHFLAEQLETLANAAERTEEQVNRLVSMFIHPGA